MVEMLHLIIFLYVGLFNGGFNVGGFMRFEREGGSWYGVPLCRRDVMVNSVTGEWEGY